MMPRRQISPGARILDWWRRLAPLPGGRYLFSRLIGFMVPYTGSIRPYIVTIEPGHAVVELRDRRRLRNHLNSIHAVALVNLGEVTSGLAMIAQLPDGIRSIVTGLSIEYVKKARGRLVAECRCTVPEIGAGTDYVVRTEISDSSGDVVARTAVTWRLSP